MNAGHFFMIAILSMPFVSACGSLATAIIKAQQAEIDQMGIWQTRK
jgi:hypothetical protein